MKHLSIAQAEQFARRELSPVEMRRLESHVARCPQCLDRVEAEIGSILGLRMMDKMRKMFLGPGAKRNRNVE